MKCCTNIYFNRHSLIRKVIPNYAKITIPYTFPASKVTLKKVHIIRIKDEIKFLYKKKQKLNRDLYDIHLKAAQEWGNIWYSILDSIHDTINQESEKKYKTISTKLNQLSKTQTNNPNHQKQFYPRVVNNTNITFTKEELSLLNKGLNYNLGYKQKNWIETLALEAETAISPLPPNEQESIRYEVAHNIRHLYKKHNNSQFSNTTQMKRENTL